MPLVNNGFGRKELKDINPASPTFGQTMFGPRVAMPDGCAPPNAVFIKSDPITEIVFKDDCESGTGGSVTYSLPEGHYVSQISKADANSKARAYFESTKQSFANLHADCGVEDTEATCPDVGVRPRCPTVNGNMPRAILCTSPYYPYCQYWSCEIDCQ